MKQQALFLTFEGIEGSGKTTQAKLLVDTLKALHVPALFTREPGGTRIGDQIRKILLHAEHTEMTPMAELLLYEASRAQHVQEVIRPHLRNGVHIICDRFGDASVAYQGRGRNLTPELVKEANRLATGGLQPDVTFLIDIDPEVGLLRARSRNIESDAVIREGRFEEEDMAFHRSVREGYLALMHENPERFRMIEGSGSFEEVAQQIRTIALPLFES